MDWILFDCDGVLLDSEAVALRTLAVRLAACTGVPENVETEIAGLLGLQVHEILAELQRRHGVVFGEDVVADIRLSVADAHRNLSSAVRDVAWALERIALPKAVVSNTALEHVRDALTRTDLARYFGGPVFSAEQVARPKPAPDLYRYAASRLGVPPRRCLVVEDSAAGVTAAVAAGMTVIGFTGGGHLPLEHAERQRSLGAVDSVGTMHELPAAVARVIADASPDRDREERR